MDEPIKRYLAPLLLLLSVIWLLVDKDSIKDCQKKLSKLRVEIGDLLDD